MTAAATVHGGLACVLACGAAGCLALATGRTEVHVELAPAVEHSDVVAIDGAVPRRVLAVQVRGPTVQARLADHRSCLRHASARTDRLAVARRVYPDWMAAVAIAEAAVGAALGAGGSLVAPSPSATAVAITVGAALAVDALATGLARAGLWHRGPVPESLQPWIEQLPPRIEPCGVDLAQGATAEVHGRRGAARAWTDGRGLATFDVRAWPAGLFPYAAPIAQVHCAGCDPVEVYLDATTSAALVRARRDPDDFLAWLDAHPDAPQAHDIRRERDRLLRAIADQQEDALRQARRAADDGDLLLAARFARDCTHLARVPAPACERLLAHIDDRFVQQQIAVGDLALARGLWQAARDAQYRCRLVDRERPACGELGRRIDLAQLRAHRLAFEAAVLRGDPGAAERAVHGILQIAPDTPLAADAQARLDGLRRTVAQQHADELAGRASRWIRKRKWARALVLLQACQALTLADTRACAALAGRLPKGIGVP
ncbi:MAG: hypothetical protein FJ100_12525 [Deltaproteobacteria bacterium]|nr:hypothetical protein [Deltaproteobacteria bacterium]